jgi:hypothetical protein
MSQKSYIPRSDAKFDAWQSNFVSKSNTYISEWSLSASALAEWELLTHAPGNKKTEWDSARAKVSSGQFDKQDIARKNQARRSYENGDRKNIHDTSLRIFIARYIRNNPQVTAAQKNDIGITVPAEHRTNFPVTIENNTVHGSIRVMYPLKHISRVVQSGITQKGLSYGVDAIEIYISVTEASDEPPTDTAQYAFDGVVKYGLYSRSFSPDRKGKRVWYIARIRYKGKKLTFGPFCDPWDALIS